MTKTWIIVKAALLVLPYAFASAVLGLCVGAITPIMDAREEWNETP
jgi:hypothetical protein